MKQRQPRTILLWKLRRQFREQLDSAPVEKRAGLRAALRGVDMLLRLNFDNRAGGRWNVESN